MAEDTLAQIGLYPQHLLNGNFPKKYAAALFAVVKIGDVMGTSFYDTLDVFLCRLSRTSEGPSNTHGPWILKKIRVALTQARAGMKNIG